MGDRSCQCLSDSTIQIQLLKSNWFCWSRDSKTSLWPGPLQKLSVPPKHTTKTLTCSTFSVGQDPKIARFCTQGLLSWHPGMAKVKCALFWPCSNKPAPFQRGQPDQRSYFQHQPQSLCFTSILGSCLQFLLFTLTFIPKTTQCAQRSYVRRTRHTK